MKIPAGCDAVSHKANPVALPEKHLLGIRGVCPQQEHENGITDITHQYFCLKREPSDSNDIVAPDFNLGSNNKINVESRRLDP